MKKQKSFVTKEELNKFAQMMKKRGYVSSVKNGITQYWNPGTKVNVSVTEGVAVFSYRQELSEVKTVREFIQQHSKKRKSQ